MTIRDDIGQSYAENRITRRAAVRQLMDDGMGMADALAHVDGLTSPNVSTPAPVEASIAPDLPRHPTQADGVVIDSVGDSYLAYKAGSERIHSLNHTAALVLELCTGANSVGEIASLLQVGYGLADSPLQETIACLSALHREQLIN